MITEKIRAIQVSRLKPFILPEGIKPISRFMIIKTSWRKRLWLTEILSGIKVGWSLKYDGLKYDYAKDQDVWLPWHKLLYNRALPVYLLENKMQKLIPRDVLKYFVRTASVEKDP